MRAAVLACLLLAGCSIVFGSAPPLRPRIEMRSDCTESLTPAVVDVVVTVAALIYAGLGLETVRGCEDGTVAECDGLEAVPIWIGLTGAAVYAASATWGIVQTRRCVRAHARHDEWRVANPPDPRAGELGRACRVDASCLGSCDDGLECVEGRCATWRTLPAEGKACMPIPDAKGGGICSAGLVCRANACVRYSWRAPNCRPVIL
jgi:hypothetical protein